MDTYRRKDDKLSWLENQFDSLLMQFQKEEKTLFPEVVDRITRTKMILYLVAICHNMNWEYLCDTVIYQMKADTNDFKEEDVLQLSQEQMENFFSQYPKKEKIEASRRLEMIKNLANYLIEYPGTIQAILKAKTVGGENGILAIVNKIPPFEEDPLHKKSNLLIQLLVDHKIVMVEDEERLEPLVDYHIMRLYLRTGRIQIKDHQLETKIRERANISIQDITRLRKTIADQMKDFCSQKGRTIKELNTIDWSIGRTFCRQDIAKCEKCPLRETCDSSKWPVEKMIVEPIDNHGFY